MSTPPVVLGGDGFATLVAVIGTVIVIPNDSVTTIALQTIAIGLALPAAAASFAGVAILLKLTKLGVIMAQKFHALAGNCCNNIDMLDLMINGNQMCIYGIFHVYGHTR